MTIIVRENKPSFGLSDILKCKENYIIEDRVVEKKIPGKKTKNYICWRFGLGGWIVQQSAER
jgi:hypothetical protein